MLHTCWLRSQIVDACVVSPSARKLAFTYLKKESFCGNIEFLYRPYDLVSVPRDQIEKEHYIFSSFGVLHIYPDGEESETLTLAEWNKAAVVWSAMRKIPFFKDFLSKKIFRRYEV